MGEVVVCAGNASRTCSRFRGHKVGGTSVDGSGTRPAGLSGRVHLSVVAAGAGDGEVVGSYRVAAVLRRGQAGTVNQQTAAATATRAAAIAATPVVAKSS